MNKELIKIYKLNTIELAKHHKKHCEGEDCNISLNILREMAERCDVKFDKKEFEVFL